jgi:hypothetical protein
MGVPAPAGRQERWVRLDADQWPSRASRAALAESDVPGTAAAGAPTRWPVNRTKPLRRRSGGRSSATGLV